MFESRVASIQNIPSNFESNCTDNNCRQQLNLLQKLFYTINDQYVKIKRFNFHVSEFKRCGKHFRKFMHLNKSPKRKGYGKFLTEEEKRRMEEFSNWSSHLSARIGIPCDYDCRPVVR